MLNNNIGASINSQKIQIVSNTSCWILVVAFILIIASYSVVQFNFGLYMKALGYEPELWLISLCAGFLGVAIGGCVPLSGLASSTLFGVPSFSRAMGMFTMFITIGHL
ncbi:MAG: hypothetical protein GYB33_02950 [Gammaproteobacteria bacterium]|nr:hypothetical protein [Gammaproteobacteria bacterium]